MSYCQKSQQKIAGEKISMQPGQKKNTSSATSSTISPVITLFIQM
jgi:hypothetical protein